MPSFHEQDHVAFGDFRGPYGYGRPAYKPDPNARYRFQPDLVRPLQVRNAGREALPRSESQSAPKARPAVVPLSYAALRLRMVAAAMKASGEKPTMEPGDRVHVKPLGVDATVREVTPLWKMGRRKPAMLYDCGFERPFDEAELTPL